MKSNFKYIIAIICIVVVLVIKFFPFGSKHNSINKSLKISLPKFSFDISKKSDDKIIFKTIRSKAIISYEFEKMLNGYNRYLCNNRYYYYDKINDLTIIAFNIKQHLFFNNVEVQYIRGRFNNNACCKVDDYKYLKYSITPVNETGFCYIPDKFNYYDEKGNKHNIYYDCFGNLLFINGMNKKIYIDQLTEYRWLSMNTLINFLEEQSKKGSFVKKIFDDEGSIIYENNDFYLLKCNANAGNKDIYIGKEIRNDMEYCASRK